MAKENAATWGAAFVVLFFGVLLLAQHEQGLIAKEIGKAGMAVH